jgi:hypothetical protein
MSIDTGTLRRLREGLLFTVDGPAVADEIDRLRSDLARLTADAALGAAVRAVVETLRAGRPDVDWVAQFRMFAEARRAPPAAMLLSAIADVLEAER